ncbi:MAG: hypothetical protein Q8T11_09035 [Elusimicrobiota bacterium]|nr:hypothetical protein [Elusimicrobiota bacterium]
MKIPALRLLLALALGAVSARAAVPARLVVPGLRAAPAFSPLGLPAASAAFAPARAAAPASLAPSLLPVPVPIVIAGPAPANASVADEARRYADFFDGAAPAVEDEPVSARLALGPGPALRRPLQLDAVRGAVARALPALRESVALGAWNGLRTTLDGSCCGDAAPKLALLLRAQGVPARLVEAELHFYVLLDLPDGQIVIDPTVRQFFGKDLAPKAIPHVFVGDLAELADFYRRHAAAKTTSFDPPRIYFRDAAVREHALRALEAEVRAGSAAEHEPLRLFLSRLNRP